MRPRVGISACLLGQKVRHDGEDKYHGWLVERLGKFVTWVPLCPEMEMGLGAPRRAMNLEGRPQAPSRSRLIVHDTREDLTSLARQSAKRMLARDLDVDSYIFKKNSPSCGLEGVKLFDRKGHALRVATGLFAAAIKKRYPTILLIEEGQLEESSQREYYALKLFAFARLRGLKESRAGLEKFHLRHRPLLAAQDPEHFQTMEKFMEKLAASDQRESPSMLLQKYRRLFLKVMGPRLTPKRLGRLLGEQDLSDLYPRKLNFGS